MYFAQLGHMVVGVDASGAAIACCDKKKNRMDVKADFLCGALGGAMLCETISAKNTANLPVVVYARFFLHAITRDEERVFLDLASKLCSADGMLAVEFRTEKDAWLRKATPNHYRRFIDPLKFIGSLQTRGFSLSYHVEGRGYAKYKEDDAHVARCLARMEEKALPEIYPLRVSPMNLQIRSEAFPS